MTKKFTSSDEVWEDYFKSHPKHEHYQTDTFEDYEDLRLVVGNGTATGKYAIGLGDDTDARTFETQENGGVWPDVGVIIPELSSLQTRSEVMGFSFSVHWGLANLILKDKADFFFKGFLSTDNDGHGASLSLSQGQIADCLLLSH
ncbi:hypothetical protein ZIOFF_003365 [Zingiber officinale]|uniref:Uncharacterized protein n=1 Tax=Zingiber officinale TaxID=94328 RepID=A0A8J5HYD5_ZINOF|nr:hypothetical protein ZIOFF_003365 [Zingiber officinale]